VIPQRRRFLQHGGLAAAAAALGGVWPSCHRPPRRESVLSAIVTDVARADVDAVAADTRALGAAVAGLVASPSVVTLRHARDQWRKALLTWKRAYCFRNGPIVETNALLRVTFWPTRVKAIETMLRADTPIDEGWLDGQGADVQGLYALEYLLFPADTGEAAAAVGFSGAGGARTRSLTGAVARELQRYSEDVTRAFGDGRAFAERFARGGQQTLSKLVGQMISTVETVAANRLQLVLDLAASRMLKASEVEGAPSGTSQAIVLAQLAGTERLYRGGPTGGITELVRAVAPAIDGKLGRAFAAAIAAVQALGVPLERVVTTNRPALASAATATKTLEVAMKVELASALGVTLTFQTGDGD
jgi:predicted lipoprotein